MAKVLKQTAEWSLKVQSWATKNMGEAAASKIFDQDAFASRIWPDSIDTQENNLRRYLLGIRKNIGVLVETAAWDGRTAIDH